MIAYCGFECDKCIIHCDGCKSSKPKYEFCEKTCEIRKCAKDKKFNTCANCDNLMSCEKIKYITKESKDVLIKSNIKNLKKDKKII